MKLRFGEWFKLVRTRADVSQKDIADTLGVKVQTVGNWEAERSVPKLDLNQTFLLCSMLKVPLETAAKAFRGEIEISV
ncbi:MAG: helix-turn-helix transcriptional regulator [Leptolyngbya sp. SIO4C1]|nr:helix-turn-helix transcriptional regulator [Leptolyngbya sp. SIO4C1]